MFYTPPSRFAPPTYPRKKLPNAADQQPQADEQRETPPQSSTPPLMPWNQPAPQAQTLEPRNAGTGSAQATQGQQPQQPPPSSAATQAQPPLPQAAMAKPQAQLPPPSSQATASQPQAGAVPSRPARSEAPATSETDTPPETSGREGAEDQRGVSWNNRPPQTQPGTPAAKAGPWFEKRSTPAAFFTQQGLGASRPSSQQGLQGSQRAIAAQQQVRGASPPAKDGRPAAQPQAPAPALRPAAVLAQNAPAAPQPPATGGESQAQQHPYKVNEADENAKFVLTDKETKQPLRKGVKFGEHARSIINEELENSPTARQALDKARDLSGKDVVIHPTAKIAHQEIGLDGTIHVYVNPDTLKTGTLAHEIAHTIQLWHELKVGKASRGTGKPPEGPAMDDARSKGRKDLHAIAPVTYEGSDGMTGGPKSNGEPLGLSKENEAMRFANVVNAEISAAKVKAKIEALKKANPDKFNEMIKNPKEFAGLVAQSFWLEQRKKESTHHQDNNNVDMPESTLYGKDYFKHVLETLGYGVTLDILKSKTPRRAEYHGFKK